MTAESGMNTLLTPTSTTQDDWPARLRGDDGEREAAIAELRVILLRGLRRSLASSIYDLRGSGPAFLEDVVQEALLKILASMDSFEGRSRFTTWALTIANRIGFSELRRHHYRDVSLDALTAGGSVDFEAHGASASQDLDRRSLLKMLRRMIDTRLSDRQRLALGGFLEGLPMAEIARRMESNRNAVYKLVHDARRRLRAGFEEAGISAQDVEALLT